MYLGSKVVIKELKVQIHNIMSVKLLLQTILVHITAYNAHIQMTYDTGELFV